jgi:L-fuculose-phosphate aldolase
MTSRWQNEKRKVVQAALWMAERGFLPGTSGNVSVRLEPDGSRELLAVTPSGLRNADLKPEDVVVVDFEAEPVEGGLTPSSETLLHLAIYRARPDVGAVVHTHSVFASVASVAGLQIPPIIDEMVVAIGGTVQVSEYAFPSTQELADNVCAALGERNAALIRNHGAVGVGRDLAEALDVCALTERVAQVFVQASLLGKVSELPPDVVEAETSIFRMRRQSKAP